MITIATHVRRNATRVTASIGAAALVATGAVAAAPVSPVSPDVQLLADATALIMGTTGVPTPDDFYVESVKNQFIAPTHPGHIQYVKVTTPEELWPLGLVNRFVSLLGIELGDPEIFTIDAAAWDVPGWGLFDRTLNQSVQAGLPALEAKMAAHGNDDLVIYGYSQSALIANREKQRLAEQYPDGSAAPDIDFVLGGDENLPNGGLFARFPGLYIPILDWSLNGPAPTDTQFDTVEIIRQYDFMGDFPLYPLNVIADLNAVMGFLFVHLYPFDVSLAPKALTSPAYRGTHGDTSYYFYKTQDLPLFAPLRMLGMPEKLIDVVEPLVRVLVELGYDRSIPAWEPTTARLFPEHDPAKVAADLAAAIHQGIDNARALFNLPPLPGNSTPVPTPTAAIEPAATGISHRTGSTPPSTAGGATQQSGPNQPTTQSQQASANTEPSTPEAKDSQLAKPAPRRSAVRDSPDTTGHPHDAPHRRNGATNRSGAANPAAATGSTSSARNATGQSQ